jgi:DNA-binding Lrp family transcriptional regulator
MFKFRTDLTWICARPRSMVPPRRHDPRRSLLVVSAYILVNTQVGKAATVAKEVALVPGVLKADAISGVYDVVVLAQAQTVDLLGKLVVAKIQSVDGITRTMTCPVISV